MIRQKGDRSAANNFCDLNQELKHLQILDSELITKLHVLAFVQIENN
jgi:hypothetical protein